MQHYGNSWKPSYLCNNGTKLENRYKTVLGKPILGSPHIHRFFSLQEDLAMDGILLLGCKGCQRLI